MSTSRRAFELIDIEGRARNLALQQRLDQQLEPEAFPVHGGLQFHGHESAIDISLRGLHRIVDGGPAHLLVGAVEVEPAAELDPHQLECLVQQHAAIARIDARYRRFEPLRAQPHFAVGMKAALRLQREWFDAASHWRRDVDGGADRVLERLELRVPHETGQRDMFVTLPKFRMPVGGYESREQRAHAAMRIPIKCRPGTNQRFRGGAPRLERVPGHAHLPGRARRGHAGRNLQSQGNEGVGSWRRRPLRGIQARNPDAVVMHDRVIVAVGQRHRGGDACRVEAALARQVAQRGDCARGIVRPSQAPSAAYSSSSV